VNAIEVHYRVLTLRERIVALQEELLKIEDSIRGDASTQMIANAEKLLFKAERELRGVATAECPESMFELSARTRSRRAEILLFPFPEHAG
jgi:hypothetical protein